MTLKLIKKLLDQKVGWIWKLMAIVFCLICFIQLILLVLAGSGFNNLTTYINEGQLSCEKYCGSKDQGFYLHDPITQACQCYSDEEEPTFYKNLQTGVEINHLEG